MVTSRAIQLLISIAISICVVSSSPILGQPNALKTAEDRLVQDYSQLSHWVNNYNYDSISASSSKFSRDLINYVRHEPATMTYPFASLLKNDNCWISDSDDGMLRIYSWDTWMGGTAHIFRSMFQFRDGRKVFVKVTRQSLDDFGVYYTRIYTLHANGRTYYIATSASVSSSMSSGRSIDILTVKNRKLTFVNLFKTKNGLRSFDGIAFNFASVRNHTERPVELIKYDSATSTLYVPVVDENEQVTSELTRYKFNGKYFEKMQ